MSSSDFCSGVMIGAALGAAAMYLLDPDAGRRRREQIRDRAARTVEDTQRIVTETARDVGTRTQEAVSEVVGAVLPPERTEARNARNENRPEAGRGHRDQMKNV